MLELRSTVERPNHLIEEEVDALLSQGDILGATHILSQVEQDDSASFSHTDFKALSLPLYELAYHPPTEARIDAANDTYGLLSDLIEQELHKLENAAPKSRGEYLGRLGELTIFSLFLRDGFNHSVPTVPVPASRQDDKFRKIDFYLSPIGTGRVDDGWPFQVKLSKYRAAQHRRVSSIPVVSLEALDKKHYRRPAHPEALTQRLLRELSGSSTDEDLKVLAGATSALYETVLQTQKVRDANRRNRELGRMVREFFQVPLPTLQPQTI